MVSAFASGSRGRGSSPGLGHNSHGESPQPGVYLMLGVTKRWTSISSNRE